MDTPPNNGRNGDTKPAKRNRDTTLSSDGKWRSFPKVPNLVQYASTGTYFGKVKVGGKPFRESLKTNVYTTAKLALADWIKKKQKSAARPVTGTCGETRADFEAKLATDYNVEDNSKWVKAPVSNSFRYKHPLFIAPALAFEASYFSNACKGTPELKKTALSRRLQTAIVLC